MKSGKSRRNTKRWNSLPACGAVLGICGTLLAQEPAPPAPSGLAFTAELHRLLRREQPDAGLVFSPLSIRQALGMAYAGARGETARQMHRALQFEGSEGSEDLAGQDAAVHAGQHALCRALLDAAASADDTRLSLAHALWAQQGSPPEQDFRDVLVQHYESELKTADFVLDAAAARVRINAWVDAHTGHRIPELFPAGTLGTDTRMVLASAVHLDARWLHPFRHDATTRQDFHDLAGARTSVPMMFLEEELAYLAGDGVELLAMPYTAPALELVVLLPAPGRYREIESRLDAARLEAWLSRLAAARPGPVQVFLPRVQLEQAFDLRSALLGLGMVDAFDEERADFSGMTAELRLFIGSVRHCSYLRIDEDGTEAAAATGVEMSTTSAPAGPIATFRADRPFLLLLRERTTGAVLFFGSILRPASS